MKKCIFCGCNSENSKSVEHIIPESLGNTIYVMPKGYVCDKCNNYFARKIESKFLNIPVIKQLRCISFTENKKGHVPSGECYIAGDKCKLDIIDNKIFIGVNPDTIRKFLVKKDTKALIPSIQVLDEKILEDNYDVARFLAKISFEIIVFKYCEVYSDKDLEEVQIVENWLTRIRDYARIGSLEKNIWPYKVKIVENDDILLKITFENIENNSYLVFRYNTIEFLFNLDPKN